jgi:hypothetical protein
MQTLPLAGRTAARIRGGQAQDEVVGDRCYGMACKNARDDM